MSVRYIILAGYPAIRYIKNDNKEMTTSAASSNKRLTKEQRIAKREATPMMLKFREIENTILIKLGPHYMNELREIAIVANKSNGGTYTDAVIMLINYYRKTEKERQWRYDHPS